MKWHGEIGFHEEVEEERGIVVPKVIPRQFFGDVLKNSWKEVPGDKINADLHISNRISVVANPYLSNNIHKIAYVTFSGAKWTVGDVEIDPDRPKRLILSLGPIYVEDEEVDDEDET
jgi:hypothetical protein